MRSGGRPSAGIGPLFCKSREERFRPLPPFSNRKPRVWQSRRSPTRDISFVFPSQVWPDGVFVVVGQEQITGQKNLHAVTLANRHGGQNVQEAVEDLHGDRKSIV